MARLGVVIINWNGRKYLETCLDSLKKQSFKDYSVVIVDNGSNDGSAEFIKSHYPDVDTIELEDNYGFAFPNNLAIEKLLEDERLEFILTLNNDTQLAPDFLTLVIDCAERHRDAGAIQPKILNFYEPNVIDSTGILTSDNLSSVNRGLKELDVGQYEREEEIFGAAASAAMYRRDALDAVALIGSEGKKDYFDSDYFAYYEDVDLALRLRLAGYRCYYAPLAKVLHLHSATGKNYSPFKAFHIHRNQYYNIIKNLPQGFMIKALALMPRVYWHSLLGIMRQKGAASELSRRTECQYGGPVRIVLRGWREVIGNLPRMLKKRRHIQSLRVVDSKEIARWFRDYKAELNKVVEG